MRRTGFIYIPQESRDNLEIGLARGVWGWKDQAMARQDGTSKIRPFEFGDYVVFGTGGPNPRISTERYRDEATLTRMVLATVVRPLYQDDRPVWPGEFPHRMDLEFLVDHSGSFTAAELGDGALEALRQSANRIGLLVPGDGLRAVGYLGEFPRITTSAPPLTGVPATHRTQRYGQVREVRPGLELPTLADWEQRKVHRDPVAVVCGDRTDGAESLVLAAEPDPAQPEADLVHVVGPDAPATANAVLTKSRDNGKSVRVLSPSTGGFRYLGLYQVVDNYLVHQAGGAETHHVLSRLAEPKAGTDQPETRTAVVTRRIRSTAVAEQVKVFYNHTCQVCRTRLVAAGRAYAEGAHIRPLGGRHEGPDRIENILCLCPNCHTLFDLGGIVIGQDLKVHQENVMPFDLHRIPQHAIDLAQLAYHWSLHRSKSRTT